MALRFPVPVNVELYPVAGDLWNGRETDSPDRRTFPNLQRLPSSQAAMKATEASYAEQLEPWTMHDPSNNGALLSEDNVIRLPAGTVVRTPTTHSAKEPPTGAKTTAAMCGFKVRRTSIAAARPTCSLCQKEYDREQQAKETSP
jgi:hypothetical protein